MPTFTPRSPTKVNILVNKDRRACIADFGLSTITGISNHTAAGVSRASLISNDTLMSFTGGGTRRWMSPELLDPERFGMPESEGNRPTRQSDCYALGMVIYEVGARASKFVVVDRLLINLGLVRTPSLPRVPVGYSSCPCDLGRGPTEQTRGGQTTRIRRRTVENCRAVLVGGSQRTTRRRRYSFSPKRRRGVLVHEKVLVRGTTTGTVS